MLAVLGIAGWGFADALMPGDRASALDVVCLSPAIGAAAAVLVSFAIALVGADPAGPLGIAALAAIAIAGIVVRARVRRRDGSSPDRSEGRAEDPAAGRPSAGDDPSTASPTPGILDPA
jgi:hypothetical protein